LEGTIVALAGLAVSGAPAQPLIKTIRLMLMNV
jgi:hypothetical protein